MATYVDGFVITVPKKQLAAYKKMATEGKQVWKKFGAIDYKECVLDDVKMHKDQKLTFPKMIQAKPSETVIFSYITYKSRAHRDKVNKAVMEYFGKKYGNDAKMPVDTRQLAVGGFTTIVE